MIRLLGTIKVTETYSGKSKFDFWKEVQVGDIISVEIPIKPTGSNGGRIYSPPLFLQNKSNNTNFSGGFNEVQVYLNKIKYEEVK